MPFEGFPIKGIFCMQRFTFELPLQIYHSGFCWYGCISTTRYHQNTGLFCTFIVLLIKLENMLKREKVNINTYFLLDNFTAIWIDKYRLLHYSNIILLVMGPGCGLKLATLFKCFKTHLQKSYYCKV